MKCGLLPHVMLFLLLFHSKSSCNHHAKTEKVKKLKGIKVYHKLKILNTHINIKIEHVPFFEITPVFLVAP